MLKSNYGYPELMVNEPQTMGERIRMLRQAKGLTQTRLAELCGVVVSAVNMWESGDTANIRLEPLAKLLHVLGTDLIYLVYGPNREPPDTTSTGRHRKITK